MPLGNGTLGAAVWAANGFTAQLNRADTMPDRKSPGWLTIPGLSMMTGAADFKGTLDLYNGVLVESGGGMTARIYVRADSDELVVDVTGADPASTQTATVTLWSGRSPQAAASAPSPRCPRAGRTQLRVVVVGPEVRLAGGADRRGPKRARPRRAGRPSPSASSRTPTDRSASSAARPSSTAARPPRPWPARCSGRDATSANLEQTNTAWWHDYWGRVGLVKITTSDGSGEYFENLRTIYLYAHAAESRGERPGSQAGVADLFNFSQDYAQWYPGRLLVLEPAHAGRGEHELREPST